MEEEIKQVKPEEKKELTTEPRAQRGEGKKEDLSSLTIEEFKQRLGECQKLKDEYLQGWQRARADFLNYKKEEMERIAGFMAYINEELILKILPILDNFEIVENKLPENLKNEENVKGILQVKTQIQDFLKNQGLEEIKTLGEKFDPNFHEIIGEVSPSEASAKEGEKVQSGIIIEEIQKGYQINGRLLRPAKVKVVK